MVVSPLATHESRAVRSSSFTSPTSVVPKFFERGVGTQVMLASMSSQAKELLLDHARRMMREVDVAKLRESLEQVQWQLQCCWFVCGKQPSEYCLVILS